MVEQEIWCLAWWADNGPPGKYVAWVFKGWLGFKIGGHSGNLVGNYVGGTDGWKPYPGVVCNGLFGFPGCGGGQVKCAQLHCSDINICRPLHNDDIVH